MQESRLFKIVYYLLDKGHATASELADRFEVSVRTIYRDIDALSGAGIPIYTEPGRNGGICLMSDFVLNRAVVSDTEKQEILTAVQSLSTMQLIGSENTLDKLSALWGVPAENWLEVDFSRWGDRQGDNQKFKILKSAIVDQRCVKITYAGSAGAVGERTIEPLRLMYKGTAWYLKAYCKKRQDYRIFKLTRIMRLKLLDTVFSPRSFPEWEDSLQDKYRQITLRFPKSLAYRVYDEFSAEEVRQEENGDLVVSVRMPEDDWLTGFLLSFGTQVEVIEPAYLRDVLAKQAKLIYEKNVK